MKFLKLFFTLSIILILTGCNVNQPKENVKVIEFWTLQLEAFRPYITGLISQYELQNPNVKIEKYIYNMEEIMTAADLAVCRSGALTVTELGIVGLPAILIPFPYAAENHQYYNAKTIEDNDAGIIIEEKDLTCELLTQKINEILNEK